MNEQEIDAQLASALAWIRDNDIKTEDLGEEACLILLRAFNEHEMKAWQEKGCSYEKSFWINFETITLWLWMWDVGGEIAVRLSKILELYLKIYSEKMRLRYEEQPAFFNLLRDRYYEINKIIEHQEPELVGRDLAKLIHKEGDDIILSVEASLFTLRMMNKVGADQMELWKLIKDV